MELRFGFQIGNFDATVLGITQNSLKIDRF